MMPEGKAFVLASASARAEVPSAKIALSYAQQDWIDEQHDLIRKAMFSPLGEERCFGFCRAGCAPSFRADTLFLNPSLFRGTNIAQNSASHPERY
jgi:hypothetical protein